MVPTLQKQKEAHGEVTDDNCGWSSVGSSFSEGA